MGNISSKKASSRGDAALRRRLEQKECLHVLKTWPPFFDEVRRGWKAFEIRKDDRGYNTHDILLLREWDPKKKEYTRRIHACKVGYVMRGPQFGLEEGYCVMSIRDCSPGQAQDALRMLLESTDE